MNGYGLTSTPLFGILICLAAFITATAIRRKTGSVVANPFLLATIMIVAVLLVFNIPYEDFKAGGDYINSVSYTHLTLPTNSRV